MNRKTSTHSSCPVLTLHGVICRHKRTHDRGDGVEGGINLSGEDEEEYSGEDQLGSIEDASPTSETGNYITSSLTSIANGHHTPPSNGMMQPSTMVNTQGYNSLQTLSMPMTISQPHALNGDQSLDGGGLSGQATSGNGLF